MSETFGHRARVEASRIASGTNLAQRVTPGVLGFDTSTMPVAVTVKVVAANHG